MYSQEEASLLKSRFWTSLGLYMAPVPSASGKKVNWINYKSSVKNIYFRMDASTQLAIISIDITPPDVKIRNNIYQQFISLKKVFEESMDDTWTWDNNNEDAHGRPVSRIYKLLPAVNIFNEQDWPAMISFFKIQLIKLDRFWNDYQEIFSVLE